MGVLFAIYKLVVFENRVVGKMYEHKTEKLGRKDAFFGVSKFTVLVRYWSIIEQLQNG